MLFQKKWLLAFPMALFGFHSTASTLPVVLENSKGESYVIEIPCEDSFPIAVEKLNQSIIQIENSQPSQFAQGFQLMLVDNAMIVRATALRNYSAPLTSAEENDISFIVKTLGNKSLFDIKLQESSLKAAGERIDHVHPLQFLAYVFTNPALTVSMRNMDGRAWVWKRFLKGSGDRKGICDSLAEEKGRNNLLQYVPDFARRVAVDINLLSPSIDSNRWEKFIQVLIKEVPKENGPGRHDM